MYSVLDTMVISGKAIRCSVLYNTLVGVLVFSVMWSDLVMLSVISCLLWFSVYEWKRGRGGFTQSSAKM